MHLVVLLSVYSLMLYLLVKYRKKIDPPAPDGEDDGGEIRPDTEPVLDLPPGVGLSMGDDERKIYRGWKGRVNA